jgi:hypothetical protein
VVPIVIDAGLLDVAGGWSDARLQVDRRAAGAARAEEPGPDRRHLEPARLLRRSDRFVCAYRCPVHGQHFEVDYRSGFARSYEVALDAGQCLCPGHEHWYVRRGVSRTSLILWSLIALWVLNLCDLLLTNHALQSGIAVEANRFMAWLLALGVVPALLIKMGIVTAGAAGLWRLRRNRVTLAASAGLVVLYALIVLYQAIWEIGIG